MQLKVLENKKLFLSYAIMNIAGYDKDNDMPMHEIRVKVRNDLNYLRDTKKVKQVRSILDNHLTYTSWLNYISIHSTEGFAKLMPEKRVVEYDYYQNGIKVKDLVIQLNKKYNLDKYYDNEIAPLYREILNQIRQDFLTLPLDNAIADFWQYKFSDKGIVYINPLDACYQAGGGKKGKTLITIPGPGEHDEQSNKVYYSGISVLGNLFHEFSHSYAKRVGNIVYNKMTSVEYRELENIYKKIMLTLDGETQEYMKHHYNNWRVYFEECFVKVADDAFITPIAFKTIWAPDEIEKHIANFIEREVQNSYLLIPAIIEEVRRVQKKNGTIVEAWINSIKRIKQEWV